MKQSKIGIKDYIKANRKGSRDAELEITRGFKSKSSVHSSKKTYSRKQFKKIKV